MTAAGDDTPGSAPPPGAAESTGESPRLNLSPKKSPWSKPNFVDNHVTDQSSVVKFIEQNWKLAALGNGSADSAAGSLMSMFDFDSQNAQGDQDQPPNGKLFLDPATGEPISFGSWLAHFASS